MTRLQRLLRSLQGPRIEHPGRVLLEQVLVPCAISQNELARLMGVPPRRVNEIVLGKRAITADTALRLADTVGFSAQTWMALQADYDLQVARKPKLKRKKRAVKERLLQRYDASRYEDTVLLGEKGDGL